MAKKTGKTTMKDYRKHDPFYAREAEKYENPIPSREYILQCMDQLGQSISAQKLIDMFRLRGPEQQDALKRRLIAMERAGQLMRNRRGNYALVDQLELVRGIIEGHKDGFGFLIPDSGEQDIFLPPYQMRSLFPGDVVLARISNTSSRGRREGIVVEILERNTHQVVGRYFKESHISFVEPHQKNIHQNILIPVGEENVAENGQYVVAEIVTHPTVKRQATGRVVEILGDHLSAGMEIEVAIRAHELPHQWPQLVKDQIKDWSLQVEAKDIEGRTDIRHLPLVTIDGEDAKDFDDAVYCEKKSSGWRLIVAIADVSHYVTKETPLDLEAQRRGTSVYFPGRVIPMLPEILANELCSLRPNVDRLCMVCDMTLSDEGELIKYQFYDAVMRSHARLTYSQVAEVIEGNDKKAPYSLIPHILNLHKLYKVLNQQRRLRGALEFETTETRIIFGKNKKIKQIIPVFRNDAHRLIEECMLMANVATSKFLGKHKIPFLYRIHEGPSPEKLENLKNFLKGFGLRLGGGDEPSSLDYADLLERIEKRKDMRLIQTVLLRSLMQAVYTPDNKGHFGLAYESYTHFTSPIRRYPDLLTHRAIRHVLQGGKKSDAIYSLEKMLVFGEHCSMTERRADTATEEVVDWLKCHYMQDKLGKTYDGIITGVTGFGVFVELTDIFVEGLVHITALKNDYYHFDQIKQTLKGKRSSTTYRLGDPLRVLVARVNLDDREIDFELAEEEKSAPKQKAVPKQRPKTKKRR